MIYFLHHFLPSRVLLSFGPITIYWYGIFIVAGILSAFALTLVLSKYYQLNKNKVFDLVFWLIIAGIAGARAYHIILEFPYYWAHPVEAIKIWHGGLAIHGAVLAGLGILFILAHRYKINFWLLASILAVSLPLGQAIGRWGNYFNQELFGRPTNLPWGIPIALANRPLGLEAFGYYHPTFLYESLGNLVIFFILLAMHKRWGKDRYLSKKHSQLIVFSYFGLYSLLRFLLEYLRLDRTPVVFGWRWPQIISLFLIIISAGFIIKFAYHKTKAQKTATQPTLE